MKLIPENDKQLAEELQSIAGHELEYHPTARMMVAEAARRLLESKPANMDRARLDWLHSELKVAISYALGWTTIPQDVTSWREKLDEEVKAQSAASHADNKEGK